MTDPGPYSYAYPPVALFMIFDRPLTERVMRAVAFYAQEDENDGISVLSLAGINEAMDGQQSRENIATELEFLRTSGLLTFEGDPASSGYTVPIKFQLNLAAMKQWPARPPAA